MERLDLAPFAVRSERSAGRRFAEPFKDDRPLFERDRDRIIHCAAFRRLEYKTQVFVNHEGDYYRTRLTHSLEVAQLARGVARRLRLNEDLAEALALAHDLGHTPFGHTGEEVLNGLMSDHGGFEHNRQSLRIVDELEERYPGFNGLNLCLETREGIIKHSGVAPQGDGALLAEFAPDKRTVLEGQIIDLVDEIAYNNHDIDDGLKSGYIDLKGLSGVPIWEETWQRVAQKFTRLDEKRHTYQTISHLIGDLLSDLVTTTCQNVVKHRIGTLEDVRNHPVNLAGLSPQMAAKNRQLKDFLHQNLYRHYKVERMRLKAQRFLGQLFEVYVENPNLLPRDDQAKYAKYGVERVVCDYIAGMTDRYALDEYKRLFDPYERV